MEVLTVDTFALFAAGFSLAKVGNALYVILGLGMVIFFH